MQRQSSPPGGDSRRSSSSLWALDLKLLNLEYSPIKGPEGNIEYLLYLQNHKEGETFPQIKVNPEKIVEAGAQKSVEREPE